MKPYYEHAGITIYHGDCREVLPELRDNENALMVADPPYGVNHKATTARRQAASWGGVAIEGDESTDARDAALSLWGDRPAIVFGASRIPRPYATRGLAIWDKGPATGTLIPGMPYKLSFEEIYFLGGGFLSGGREGVIKRHWMVTWESRGRVHPHQKPISLLLELIQTHDAEMVVDPFTGSGTVLEAAKRLGRRAIGIEIEERYCEIAARRLQQEVLFGGAA